MFMIYLMKVAEDLTKSLLKWSRACRRCSTWDLGMCHLNIVSNKMLKLWSRKVMCVVDLSDQACRRHHSSCECNDIHTLQLACLITKQIYSLIGYPHPPTLHGSASSTKWLEILTHASLISGEVYICFVETSCSWKFALETSCYKIGEANVNTSSFVESSSWLIWAC